MKAYKTTYLACGAEIVLKKRHKDKTECSQCGMANDIAESNLQADHDQPPDEISEQTLKIIEKLKYGALE